jgi:predicted outer membrane repeat protein
LIRKIRNRPAAEAKREVGDLASLRLFLMILFTCAIALAGTVGPAGARTWTVPDDVPTIAAAIDSAGTGDVVELAAGVHAAYDLELFLIENLTIRAADPLSGATIDGGGQGRIFHAALCDSLTLEGLTFTGGYYYNGAAGKIDSCPGVEIRGCSFVENLTTMGIGGALQVGGETSILIEDCLFQDNEAPLDDGGALYLSCPAAVISHCTFVGNQAINGGGISCKGADIHISACVFYENSASNGAGIDVQNDAVVVTDCLFAGNTATRGGAAGCWYGATPLFAGCTMVENWGHGSRRGPLLHRRLGGHGGTFDPGIQHRRCCCCLCLFGDGNSGLFRRVW